MSTPKYNTIQCKGSSESSLRRMNELFIQANFNKHFRTEEGEYLANILNDLRDVKNAVAALTNEFNNNSIAPNLSVAANIATVPDASATPPAPTGNIFVSSSITHPEDYNNITRIICPTMPNTLASQNQFNSDAHDFLFTDNKAKFKKTIANNIDGLVKLAKLFDGGITSKFDFNMNKLKVIFQNDATVTELISLIEEEKNVLSAFWSGASMWHRAIVEFTSDALTAGTVSYVNGSSTVTRYYTRELLSLVLYMKHGTVDLSNELMFYAFEKYSVLFLEYLKTIPVFMTGGSRNSEYLIFDKSKNDKPKFCVLFEKFIKNPGAIDTNNDSVSDHLDAVQRIKILGVIAGIFTAFGEPVVSPIDQDITDSTFGDWFEREFGATSSSDSEIVTKVKAYASTPVSFVPTELVSFEKLTYGHSSYVYTNVFSITSTPAIVGTPLLSGTITFDGPVTKVVRGSVHTFMPVSGTVIATIPTGATTTTTVTLSSTVSLVVKLDSIVLNETSDAVSYSNVASITSTPAIVGTPLLSGTITFNGPVVETITGTTHTFTALSGNVVATIPTATSTTTVTLSTTVGLVIKYRDLSFDSVNATVTYSNPLSISLSTGPVGTPAASGTIDFNQAVNETINGLAYTYTTTVANTIVVVPQASGPDSILTLPAIGTSITIDVSGASVVPGLGFNAVLTGPVFSDGTSHVKFSSMSCSNFAFSDNQVGTTSVRTFTFGTTEFTTTSPASLNGTISNFTNSGGILLDDVVFNYTGLVQSFNVVPSAITSGALISNASNSINFTNVFDNFVKHGLERLLEFLPFNTAFAKVCLFGCQLVVDMLDKATPDYVTGTTTTQVTKLIDLINTTFGVNDYVPLSVTKPGTSRNWFNSELEDYIHVALFGQFLISGKFARIFTEMQFGILDASAFNFIPVTKGGFVETDSDLTLVLPSMNSRVRVHNTGSKTVKVRVLHCRGDTLHTSNHLQTVSAGEDCHVYAHK